MNEVTKPSSVDDLLEPKLKSNISFIFRMKAELSSLVIDTNFHE